MPEVSSVSGYRITVDQPSGSYDIDEVEINSIIKNNKAFEILVISHY